MREDAVRELLRAANAPWEVVERLVERGDLMRIRHRDEWFYLRRFAVGEAGPNRQGDAGARSR